MILILPHGLGGLVEQEGRRQRRREDQGLGECAATAPLRVEQHEAALVATHGTSCGVVFPSGSAKLV
eukprot:625810-Prymnesium_polylepis.1